VKFDQKLLLLGYLFGRFNALNALLEVRVMSNFGNKLGIKVLLQF
jgi:hypothetical protein